MGKVRLRTFGDLFLKFVAGMNAAATIWIFFLMFLITADVLGRVLMNMPVTGTPELVRISLVGIFALQIPHSFWMDRQVKSDIIMRRLPFSYKNLLNSFINIVGSILFACIAFGSLKNTIVAWKILEYEGEGSLRVPVYPIRTLIIFGSVIVTILFLVRFVQHVQMLRRGNKEKH